MTVTVAISLKMYFSHARTLNYCASVAELAVRDAGVARGTTELVVLPTFVSIPGALGLLAGTPVRVGAQDLCTDDAGAFTGEVSGAELAELGCSHVEVGHAERRRLFGEDEAMVTAKTGAAIRNGLVPILCVGEPTRVEPGPAADVCVRQTLAALEGGDLSARIVVAYEPHWAIGQPHPAPTGYVREVCERTRSALAGRLADFAILYGGSAGPGLLTELSSSVDGLFLGRFAHEPQAVQQVLDEAGRPLR